MDENALLEYLITNMVTTEEVADIVRAYAGDICMTILAGSFLICGTLIGLSLLRGFIK